MIDALFGIMRRVLQFILRGVCLPETSRPAFVLGSNRVYVLYDLRRIASCKTALERKEIARGCARSLVSSVVENRFVYAAGSLSEAQGMGKLYPLPVLSYQVILISML